MRWVGVLVVGGLVACGGDGSNSADPPMLPAGGGSAGLAGSSGAAGMAGGAGGTGGGSGGSTGGQPSAVVLTPQPECDLLAQACEGECLLPGESANGCTYLLDVLTLTSLLAHGGDLYLSTTFLSSYGDVVYPADGLYRMAGDTLELTPLDIDQGMFADDIAIVDETVYYSPTNGDVDSIRAVPATGGTSTELVTGIASEVATPHEIVVSGGRIYFVGRPDSGPDDIATVYWIPSAGGEMTRGNFNYVHQIRANSTDLAVSFNGNISTSPFPDIALEVELFGDFGLPTTTEWWLDDDFIYWRNDTAYRRLSLDTVAAEEELGETIQTLPMGLTLFEAVGNEWVMTASNNTVTGIYVMPTTGGEIEPIGVVGSRFVDAVALDENYVYVNAALGLMRFDR